MSRQIKTTPLFNNLDDQIIINQEDSEQELTEVMKEFCATIGEKFYKFKFEFQKSEDILQKNYYKNENNVYIMNKNFAEIELIEENLDKLFYRFKVIKQEIAKARIAHHYIECKRFEKEVDKINTIKQ